VAYLLMLLERELGVNITSLEELAAEAE